MVAAEVDGMHTCQFLLQDVAFSLLFWSSPEIGGFASQRTSNSPLNVCNTHRRCLVPSQWSALKPFGNKSDKAGTMDSCLSSFGKVLCLAVKGFAWVFEQPSCYSCCVPTCDCIPRWLVNSILIRRLGDRIGLRARALLPTSVHRHSEV